VSADERGKIKKAAPQTPKTSPVDRRSFFQRFFNPFHGPAGATPAPRSNPAGGASHGH